MDNKKQKSTKFQIKSIKIIDFCIIPPKNKKKGEEIQFNGNVKTEYLANIESNAFAIKMILDIENNKKEKYVSITTENHFEVENLKQFIVEKESNSIELPEIIYGTMINTCIGSVRGILVTKVGGTSLEKMVLPLISVKGLIPNKPIKFS